MISAHICAVWSWSELFAIQSVYFFLSITFPSYDNWYCPNWTFRNLVCKGFVWYRIRLGKVTSCFVVVVFVFLNTTWFVLMHQLPEKLSSFMLHADLVLGYGWANKFAIVKIIPGSVLEYNKFLCSAQHGNLSSDLGKHFYDRLADQFLWSPDSITQEAGRLIKLICQCVFSLINF